MNKSRIIIKAVGDYDFSRTVLIHGSSPQNSNVDSIVDDMADFQKNESRDEDDAGESLTSIAMSFNKEYINSYKPHVIKRQWFLSETDLQWITTGCYILGTGAGGTPYQHMLRLREMLRAGAVVRIISPWDLQDDDVVACGGGKGSPQVSIEKPYGNE